MRVVIHIDMDAFFAAIEERANPRYKGMPIVVCTSTPLSANPLSVGQLKYQYDDGKSVSVNPEKGEGRGVVSTCNYPARKYGIHSAMPIRRAWELSEAAKSRGESSVVFLPVDHEFYSKVSERIMDYLRLLGDNFEAASVDEAYIEPQMAKGKEFIDAWQNAEKLAAKIKQEIKRREGLTCSIGIGPNKLIAKIASGQNKPDGLTVVKPGEVQKFLDPMLVRELPGIGPKTEILLHRKNIKTIKDLRQIPQGKLEEWLGKWGGELYRKARGESEAPVSGEWERKSIGEQETFEKDTLDGGILIDKLNQLSLRVWERFKKSKFSSFRTVVITVRFADFATQSRSRTLPKPEANLAALQIEAMKLVLPFLDKRENPRHKPIRLVGVRIEKFEG